MYWSPGDAIAGASRPLPAESMLLGDGGLLDNSGVIDLLLREVTTIVSLISTGTALASSETWSPGVRQPTPSDVDSTICSLFGVRSCSVGDPFGFAGDESRNQVFSTSDFAPLMVSLQQRAAAGEAAITTSQLTTVDNSWWGLAAGLTVNVTWIYLTPYGRFEQQLAPDVIRALHEGEFGPGFPNLPLGNDVYKAEQVNLLAAQTAAAVLDNSQIFLSAMGPPPMNPVPSASLSAASVVAIVSLLACGLALVAVVSAWLWRRGRPTTRSTLHAKEVDVQVGATQNDNNGSVLLLRRASASV